MRLRRLDLGRPDFPGSSGESSPEAALAPATPDRTRGGERAPVPDGSRPSRV